MQPEGELRRPLRAHEPWKRHAGRGQREKTTPVEHVWKPPSANARKVSAHCGD